MFDFGDAISGDPVFIQHAVTIGIIPSVLALFALIIHLAFAIAIFNDALARRRTEQFVWFVHPIFWAGATLIGSVFVAGVYWAIHYSTLAPTRLPAHLESTED